MQEIKMPSAGQTTDEATIVAVHVKPGDTIKRGDVLVEAETDKAILPVESFAAGQVIDVLVSEGSAVTAGTVLAVVGKAGEVSAGHKERMEPSQPAAKAAQSVAASEEEEDYLPIMRGQPPIRPQAVTGKAAPAMPNAKLLARERGIDLSDVIPSNGRFIKRQDVPPAPGVLPSAPEPDYQVMPMTRARAVIARRMLESKQTIPAWQGTIFVNMEACLALRASYQEALGVKLSYNDILAKTAAKAAQEFPLINARYEDGEVRVCKHTNVGLAVALENALVVPVVCGIEEKGLTQISEEFKAQIRKARDGRLTPADMGCGSVTISNLGMYGVDWFQAIVNPPESSILAVGGIRVDPVWDGTEFRPAHRMSVTGSFDHRIIDGAYGARFLQKLKILMETPGLMLG